KAREDCPEIGGVSCAAAGGDGERVCWFGDQPAGEIALEKKPEVLQITWPECGVQCLIPKAATAAWRFIPGSTGDMNVTLVKRGTLPMYGGATAESDSPLLEIVSPGASYMMPSFGMMDLAVTAQVSPDAPLDQPLPFDIVLTDADGDRHLI